MFERRFLGQVPLRAPGMTPVEPPGTQAVPPYYGQWGVHEGAGVVGASGAVGPFATMDEAFTAAADAAHAHGAEVLPGDGFAQVVDSRGRGVGPIT